MTIAPFRPPLSNPIKAVGSSNMNQSEEPLRFVPDCEVENSLKLGYENKQTSKPSLKANRRKYTRKPPDESAKRLSPKDEEVDDYSEFLKDDGKLIFKITRYNKITHKEKILTKSRRIISKCPHTSMKYYAKGM